MTNLDTLRSEFGRASGEHAQLDLNLATLRHTIGAANSVLSLYLTVQAKTHDVTKVSNDLVKVLSVTQYLPFGVGTVSKAVLRVYSKVHYGTNKLDDVLTKLHPKLEKISTALTTLAASTYAAQQLSDQARENEDGLRDGLTLAADALSLRLQDAAGFDQGLTDELTAIGQIADAIGGINDTANPVFDPIREAEAFFREVNDNLSRSLGWLDEVARIADQISGPLDALEQAIRPVSWALGKAQAVVDQVVQPVIDAILSATGLNDLLDQAGRVVSHYADQISSLTRALSDMEAYIDDNFIPRLNTAWGTIEPAFALDGPVSRLKSFGPVSSTDAAGQLLWVDDGGDTAMTGTTGDDIMIGGNGNDALDGDQGTDVAGFAGGFTEFKVYESTSVTDLIHVDWRSARQMAEGSDTVRNFEYLLFDEPGLGLVPVSEVSKFRYTSPGSPNLSGTDAEEWLIGDDAANDLRALGGNDSLFGGRGNDILRPGSGNDRVFAGDGDDTIHYESGADVLLGGAGFDTLYYTTAPVGSVIDLNGSRITGPGGQLVVLSEIERLVLGAAGDHVISSSAAEAIETGDGDDLVELAGVNDVIRAGNGVDTVSFLGSDIEGLYVEMNGFNGSRDGAAMALEDYRQAPGNTGPDVLVSVEQVIGTDGSDVMRATGRSRETIRGDSFTLDWARLADGTLHTITGSAFRGEGGADLFVSGLDSDAFDGGAGIDFVSYMDPTTQGLGGFLTPAIIADLAVGTVTTRVGSAPDTDLLLNVEGIIATPGLDELRGDAADNAFYGLEGKDILEGRGGDDFLDGGGSADTLRGGDGNDYLVGGGDADIYDGGAGSDTADLGNADIFQIDKWLDPTTQAMYQQQEALAPTPGGGAIADLAAGTATTFEVNAGGDPMYPTEIHETLISIENLFGTSFGDQFAGSAVANVLHGRGGDDILDGRGGNDTLIGGAGRDTLRGGDGDDILNAGGGAADVVEVVEDGVTYNEGTGLYPVFHGWTNPGGSVDVWNEREFTNAGVTPWQNHTLIELDTGVGTGTGGIDRLEQTFTGVAGATYRFRFAIRSRYADGEEAAPGFTKFYSPSQTVHVSVNGLDLSGGGVFARGQGDWTEVEFLYVSDGSDTIVVSEDPAGDDGSGPFLDGLIVERLGSGGVMNGGAGADSFVISPGDGVQLIEDFTPGTDRLDLQAFSGGKSNITFTLPDGLMPPGTTQTVVRHDGNVVAILDGIDPALLSPSDLVASGAETLTGTEADDILDGRTGNDRIDALGGDDLVFGGTGKDRIDAGAGIDTVEGGAGADRIRGADGNDTLKGEAGEDRLWGGGGNDDLRGGAGDDTSAGGQGNDRLFGGGGADALSGGAGDDILRGGRGTDTLQGNGGNDRLAGGDDADILDGGAGDDMLEGGRGADNFVFSGGHDRVLDFDAAQDRLLIDSGLPGAPASVAALGALSSLGADGNLVIAIDAGNSLELVGITDFAAISAAVQLV